MKKSVLTTLAFFLFIAVESFSMSMNLIDVSEKNDVSTMSPLVPLEKEGNFELNSDMANSGSLRTFPEKIQFLCFYENYLKKIAEARGLPNFESLLLQTNGIDKLISMLEEVPDLQCIMHSPRGAVYLNFKQKALTTLVGLSENLSSLKYLDLSNNNLQNFIGIPSILPYLIRLDISFNRFNNLNDLPEMPNLVELRIQGNPLSKDVLMEVPWENFPNLALIALDLEVAKECSNKIAHKMNKRIETRVPVRYKSSNGRNDSKYEIVGLVPLHRRQDK